METEINFFLEDMVENTMDETQQTDIYFPAFINSGPKDDDDEDSENSEDENDNTFSDDDPPLNSEVVHSPVTTMPGGKPGS